jgi:hypothetical protein
MAQFSRASSIASKNSVATTRHSNSAAIVQAVIAMLVKCRLRSRTRSWIAMVSGPMSAMTSRFSVRVLPRSTILDNRLLITFRRPAMPVSRNTGANAS